jgi:hypothetical protein
LPNLQSLTTCCVCLEPRPLPSTGITRLHRYNGPLRHPRAPGPSLTGFRLVIPAPRLGASRVACAFLVCVLSPLPRRSNWEHCFAHLSQPYQPSPKGLSGRPAHRPFRGLLSVHSRYGPHTRAVTFRDPLPEGFSHIVTSMTAPVASGWSRCRVGLAPTGKRRLFTAHTPTGHQVVQFAPLKRSVAELAANSSRPRTQRCICLLPVPPQHSEFPCAWRFGLHRLARPVSSDPASVLRQRMWLERTLQSTPHGAQSSSCQTNNSAATRASPSAIDGSHRTCHPMGRRGGSTPALR